MAMEFPKLMTNTKPQIQEAQRTSSRIDMKNYVYTEAYHIQTAEKQRQRENLENIQKGKIILPIED